MNTDFFCPLPWVHQATYTDGSILLCCVAENRSGANINHKSLLESFNSEHWRDVRRQMLNGGRPEACRRCWIEEQNGGVSHRLTELEVWTTPERRSRLQELVASTAPDGRLNARPVSLDLRIGNTCNLQCVMCQPHESSKWRVLAKSLQARAQHPALRRDLDQKLTLQFDALTWPGSIWAELREIAGDLEELIFGGGEPMLLRGHVEFLEFCVRQRHAAKILLRYHTNLTTLDPALFDLWRHFGSVEFCASIDGWGDKNHYVRYPAKWTDIERNLERLDNAAYPNVKTMILFSAHVLSLYNFDELAAWVERRRFKKVTQGFSGGHVHPSLVMHPEYLSPQVYPRAVKEAITHRLTAFEARSRKPSRKVAGVLRFMNERDRSDLLPVALEYIQLLDRTRGTNFAATFPELAGALGYRADSLASISAD